ALDRADLRFRQVEAQTPLRDKKSAHDESNRHSDQCDDESDKKASGFLHRSRGEQFLEELKAVVSNFVASWFDLAPDRRSACECLHVRTERFDNDIALVANCLKSSGD